MQMAVFLVNNCKFSGCGLTFSTLGELIQHIEETHIGRTACKILYCCASIAAVQVLVHATMFTSFWQMWPTDEMTSFWGIPVNVLLDVLMQFAIYVGWNSLSSYLNPVLILIRLTNTYISIWEAHSKLISGVRHKMKLAFTEGKSQLKYRLTQTWQLFSLVPKKT